MSEALLFKHFPTKRALYAAILEDKAHYTGLREAAEEAAKNKDDARLFTLLAGSRIRKGADPTLLRLLLFSALEGHELSDMFFRRQYSMFYDLLAQYIGRWIEDGAFRPVDPRLAARAFFGIIVHHRLLHDILALPMHRLTALKNYARKGEDPPSWTNYIIYAEQFKSGHPQDVPEVVTVEWWYRCLYWQKTMVAKQAWQAFSRGEMMSESRADFDRRIWTMNESEY